MNMVRYKMTFHYFALFLSRQVLENLTQIFPKLFMTFFLSIFRYPGYMIYVSPFEWLKL